MPVRFLSLGTLIYKENLKQIFKNKDFHYLVGVAVIQKKPSNLRFPRPKYAQKEPLRGSLSIRTKSVIYIVGLVKLRNFLEKYLFLVVAWALAVKILNHYFEFQVESANLLSIS